MYFHCWLDLSVRMKDKVSWAFTKQLQCSKKCGKGARNIAYSWGDQTPFHELGSIHDGPYE